MHLQGKYSASEVGFRDYIGEIVNASLYQATAGSPKYAQACRYMYAHYVATHETINPWTGDYETFCRKLPETVCYAESAARIIVCSFVEEYETVCFESDDCDWAAMALRHLFQHPDESSYDSYFYDTP